MGSQPYFPNRSVLFRKEASGVTYRIPALVFLPRSSCFLAFCEERLSPADSDTHLLVMRKGIFQRNDVKWEDTRVLNTACLLHHRSMNPCPVYDAVTGTLFLFFIAVLGHTTEAYQLETGKNACRLCCVSSDDCGQTWSPVADLTQNVIGETIKEWATFALGPGHGIQLKSGRLLIPAYSYNIDCRNCFGKVCKTTPRSFCFHSDTHGRAWRLGRAVPGPECMECQLVWVDEEAESGVLYCNARSTHGSRVQALSFDGGASFQDGQLVPKLTETRYGCHGSMVGFEAPCTSREGYGRSSYALLREDTAAGDQADAASRPDFVALTWVVYGHPTCPDARRNLGLYLSTQPRDPRSWTEPWIIYDGPSAYSDLACVEVQSAEAMPVTAFACLFENGTETAYEEISFCMFTLHELISNINHCRCQGGGGLDTHKQKQRKRTRAFESCSVC